MFISGAILFEEAIHQQLQDDRPFGLALADLGIIAGIKVDAGANALARHAGESVTEGLDGLRERLQGYVALGARFAKWRAVIEIDAGAPSTACIMANALALARYAVLCQEAGLVPIVESEVLMSGDHSLQRCAQVTAQVLHEVFEQLHAQRVMLEGLLLKPNMVLSGLGHADQDALDDVADATVTCLLRAVPAAVPGIAFFSGGQSAELASARLNAMNQRFRGRLLWPLTFSFSRAIHWVGDCQAAVGQLSRPAGRSTEKRLIAERSFA